MLAAVDHRCRGRQGLVMFYACKVWLVALYLILSHLSVKLGAESLRFTVGSSVKAKQNPECKFLHSRKIGFVAFEEQL